ncbi:polyketide cyclase [Mycobacterium asiaticum]|uniref:Polyketide cyclase n=2 Tax=Mycobacterium asiaticum TaxID=1790 RepID=A0A1A3N1W1_MYCAS|nr:SRPBCC family protein [Mycobacterium asiaticum]OBK15776.1 polyketide cyclase [Mycobacterium asiaticum]
MLSVHRVIAAPPQALWELLVDLDAWPQWGPTIARAELDRPYQELELGATGTVQTPVLVGVPFVVTEFDPGRFWAWKVAGIPATSHRVDPTEQGARVTMAVPWWAAPYLSVCSVALRRMEKMVGAA